MRSSYKLLAEDFGEAWDQLEKKKTWEQMKRDSKRSCFSSHKIRHKIFKRTFSILLSSAIHQVRILINKTKTKI